MSNNALLLHGRDDHAPLFALSRGSALVYLKVGMARRRRPIFAAKQPLYPPTPTASSEAWDPDGAASLPFSSRKVLPHQPRGSAS
jgi:hypothetical protein